MARGRERALKKWGDRDAPLPTLGGVVVDWCLEFLVHGQGGIQGRPLELHEDQQLLIWRAYEFARPGTANEGRRLHTEVVNMGPKGIAKSECAAAICCAEAFGPVVFDGWDASGEPVGRPLEWAQILIVATEEGQSGNTYEPLAYMLNPETCRPEFRAEYGAVDIGRDEYSSTRTVLPNHRGLIIPGTAGASSKEGKNATHLVLEESHLYLLPVLHKLHSTLRRGLAKPNGRDAWAHHPTNAPEPGAGSVLEKVLHDIGKVEGTILVARQVPAGLVPDDVPVRDLPDRVLLAALREVYGSAWKFQNQAGIVREIRRPSTDDSDARRFYLNQASRGEKRWADPKQVAHVSTPDRLADGDQIALGFDGSRYHDATVLEACRPSDGLLQPLAWFEKPEGPAGRGWEVTNAQVKDAVREAFRRFRVVKMYGDPPHWRDELDDLAGEFGKAVVLEFDTNKKARMAPALERFETALATGQLRIADDPDLLRHLLNAEAVKDARPGPDGRRATVRLQKPEGVDPDSMRARIDGAVAGVLAYEAAMDAVREGLVADGGPVFAF